VASIGSSECSLWRKGSSLSGRSPLQLDLSHTRFAPLHVLSRLLGKAGFDRLLFLLLASTVHVFASEQREGAQSLRNHEQRTTRLK